MPWISILGLGLLAHDLAVDQIRWGPLAASMALFNLAVGALHALAGRARSPRDERHAISWHLLYAFVSAILYVELLNLAKRTGHLRELRGQRHWVVTPRPNVDQAPDALAA